jgi:hypothetical protein
MPEYPEYQMNEHQHTLIHAFKNMMEEINDVGLKYMAAIKECEDQSENDPQFNAILNSVAADLAKKFEAQRN